MTEAQPLRMTAGPWTLIRTAIGGPRQVADKAVLAGPHLRGAG